MEFKGNPECDPSMGSKGIVIPPEAGCVAPSALNGEFPFAVLVCIAKMEQNYIEEFVHYHLLLGFARIYLFDNEDVPTYASLLHEYVATGQVIVNHLPHNNYFLFNDLGQRCYIPVQYVALTLFIEKIMPDPQITHVAHIDIDEFIVLKKHGNICELVEEYIKDDCAGIAMNWRMFGSSGHTEYSDEPVTSRFTMCEIAGNHHIKTLFRKDLFANLNTCHTIIPASGYYIKSTNGTVIQGHYNDHIDYSVVQLNHYKCKTLPEFRKIRTRQRADVVGDIHEDVDAEFKKHDINEVEDLTACEWFKGNSPFPLDPMLELN